MQHSFLCAPSNNFGWAIPRHSGHTRPSRMCVGLAHLHFLVAHFLDMPACTPIPFLVQCPSTGTRECPSKHAGHTRGRTRWCPRQAGRQAARAQGAQRAPRGRLSACPSARGSAVVNDAFDGGRICCARSERAPIIWKAEIRNTIYSAALWKQFPALYNPILGQPPGAGQITIGYSLSSPGTKISRPR